MATFTRVLWPIFSSIGGVNRRRLVAATSRARGDGGCAPSIRGSLLLFGEPFCADCEHQGRACQFTRELVYSLVDVHLQAPHGGNFIRPQLPRRTESIAMRKVARTALEFTVLVLP